MPITVNFIQCDSDKCKKDPGKLVLFAGTRHSMGLACGDGGTNAEFFECDKCGTIYMRHRYSSGNYMSSEPDSFSDFHVFRLKATREELIEFGPACSGYYGDYDDNKIIEAREAKLKVLKELERKLRVLKNLTSINAQGKARVLRAPVKAGDSGLGYIIVSADGKNKYGSEYASCLMSSEIKEGDEILLITEAIAFHPHDSFKCLFAVK